MSKSSIQWFAKDDGRKLPVSDEFLLPFLSPTSPGTNYWDPPPPKNKSAMERSNGRALLQLHQIVDLLRRCGIDLKNKNLLDIGTGNGMIPRLLLHYSDLQSAIGIDPYLDGEHLCSKQPHDHGKLFKEISGFIDIYCKDEMNFERYAHMTGHLDFTIQPARVPLTVQPRKEYRFEKIGAHDLGDLDEKFDIFYAKAIDHVPDWPGVFKACADASNDNAVIVLKHFSFFSLLGPHRFGTTNIPWGHLLLSDREYRRFAHEFHNQRAQAMIDFYFSGLAYPRYTIHDMIMMASQHGFTLNLIVNEPSRHAEKLLPLTRSIPDFWKIVHDNYPAVTIEEMLSGRYHIVFRKTHGKAQDLRREFGQPENTVSAVA